MNVLMLLARQIDIIIMDINMPNLDGLQTLKIMRRENINKKL